MCHNGSAYALSHCPLFRVLTEVKNTLASCIGLPILLGPTTNGGITMANSNAQRADEGEAPESAGKRPIDTARHGTFEIAIWHGAICSGLHAS